MLAIPFVPLALAVLGTYLEAVASTVVNAQQRKDDLHLLQKTKLTLREIRALDSDGDGNVSRSEFLQFMLLAMNQVDKDLLDRLNKQFDQVSLCVRISYFCGMCYW